MYKYLLIMLCLLFTARPPAFASCHVSDCPDEDFIELGSKYPSVGIFSTPDGPFGSGTLVDVDLPELQNLKGRVVVTCSHMFEEESSKDIIFSIGDFSATGIPYIHPQYEETNTNQGIGERSYDIGLFILDKAASNIPAAQIGWDMPYEDLLEKDYVSVGFGNTSHIFGKHEIHDLCKRGSFAYAHLQDNPLMDEVIKSMLYFDGINGTPVTSVRKQGSVLTLCPYITSKYIDEQNTLETFRKPAGVARSGDSGGGVFEAENSQLIAVISGGKGSKFEKETVIEKSCFSKFEKAIRRDFQEGQAEYDELLQSSGKIQLENSIRPVLPRIIEADEIDALMKDRYQKEDFYYKPESTSPPLIVDLETVVISYHKDWIINTLRSLTEFK